MQSDQATSIAQDALLWLSGDPEMLSHFLQASGASPEDVKKGLEDQEFLGFVLDFVLMSDETVVGAAAAAGVSPERILRARAVLPGGETPNYT